MRISLRLGLSFRSLDRPFCYSLHLVLGWIDENTYELRRCIYSCTLSLILYLNVLLQLSSPFKDQKQLAGINNPESKPATSWVKNLVSENEEMKEILGQWSSESERLIIQNEIMKKEVKKQIEAFESQESQWRVEKENLLKEIAEKEKALEEKEMIDGKRLTDLKDVYADLSLLSGGNPDEIGSKDDAVSKEKRSQDTVDDLVTKMSAAVTHLCENIKRLAEENEKLDRDNKEINELVEFIELENKFALEELRSVSAAEKLKIPDSVRSLCKEMKKLKSENQKLKDDVKEQKELIEFTEFEHRFTLEEFNGAKEQYKSLVENAAVVNLESARLAEENAKYEIQIKMLTSLLTEKNRELASKRERAGRLETQLGINRRLQEKLVIKIEEMEQKLDSELEKVNQQNEEDDAEIRPCGSSSNQRRKGLFRRMLCGY